jgi:tRNA1Val (adenine37-N6)-methyltransferase
MNDYLQPDFYRFNQDSLKLVEWVFSRIKKANKILDLGAGSGIIGIELANKLSAQQLTLVELQNDFLPYLEKNIKFQLKGGTQAEVLISSFGDWPPRRTFDLIVCNPPYYLPGHGQPSEDQRRGIARTFLTDHWEILLSRIEESLTPEGKACLVIKNDERILKLINHTYLRSEFYLDEVGELVFVELSRLNIDRN